jgi:hypothetical protein
VYRTPVALCIERAVKTNQEYLIPVIEKMAQEWEEVGTDEGPVLLEW